MSNPLLVNGWKIGFQQVFIDQLVELLNKVERARAKNPTGYKSKNSMKRLAAIYRFLFQEIPQDPGHDRYEQGNTLGEDYRGWRRESFYERYRLYFRYDTSAGMIVYGWVNDENTLRARGSKTDAYAVFSRMLANGNPPNRWEDLVAACAPPAAIADVLTRLARFFP